MSEANNGDFPQPTMMTIPSNIEAAASTIPRDYDDCRRRRHHQASSRSNDTIIDADDEKELRSSLIRSVLPDCQPQEGSPANTFTDHELQELQAALLPQMNIIRPLNNSNNANSTDNTNISEHDNHNINHNNNNEKAPINNNMMNIMGPWEAPKEAVRAAVLESSNNNSNVVKDSKLPATISTPCYGDVVVAETVNNVDDKPANHTTTATSATNDECPFPQEPPQEVSEEEEEEAPSLNNPNECFCPQEPPQEEEEDAIEVEEVAPPSSSSLDWHGAPSFPQNVHVPREFRKLVRSGAFTGPTNAVCSGFLQCNLVVLPKLYAFDFLLFCQRNPKACPLIEVCESGSSHPIGVAPGADLKTDVPKYAIYRNGELEQEVPDVTEYWPEDSVAFLIGCSFSYDGALMDAGIPLRSAEAGKNVPMYRTTLPCRSAGSLHGNMVVSMKPIPAMKIAKHVEITSKYTHAHGGPVCVGRPECIGIMESALSEPDWGEPIDIRPDEIPVFHACGVTPQSVLMDSKIPFAITHAAGHMFVTDLPADMGVL